MSQLIPHGLNARDGCGDNKSDEGRFRKQAAQDSKDAAGMNQMSETNKTTRRRERHNDIGSVNLAERMQPPKCSEQL